VIENASFLLRSPFRICNSHWLYISKFQGIARFPCDNMALVSVPLQAAYIILIPMNSSLPQTYRPIPNCPGEFPSGLVSFYVVLYCGQIFTVQLLTCAYAQKNRKAMKGIRIIGDYTVAGKFRDLIFSLYNATNSSNTFRY